MRSSEQAFNVTIGRVLRDIRRAQKMSIQALCDLSGGTLDKGALGTYERGERSMSVVRLDMIADLLGTTIHEVMTRAMILHGMIRSPDRVENITIGVERLRLSDHADIRLIAHWLELVDLLEGDTVTVTQPMLLNLSLRLRQPAGDIRRHLEKLC